MPPGLDEGQSGVVAKTWSFAPEYRWYNSSEGSISSSAPTDDLLIVDIKYYFCQTEKFPKDTRTSPG